MRILVRTSKWAIWARRVGALALPLAAIPVLLHRANVITSQNFITIEAVALSLAALAVLMALIAFTRLWFTGDQGWWKATLAFIFGIICLAPAGFFAYETLRQPNFPDVTTDFSNPPALTTFVESRFTTPEQRATIEAQYPNARSRNYPITAPELFDTISGMIADRGWDVRAPRRPTSQVDGGTLNAIVTTLLGFRQEVAIRITGTADGTTVAMRATSLSEFPDYGQNGQVIESFMLDLDNQVTLMLRNSTPAQPADSQSADN
jgi:hypothetical protein